MPNTQSEIEEVQQQTSVRDLFDILLRHKRKMLVFFVAAVVCATVLVLCSEEKYLSEAILLVRLGRESVALDPTATTGEIVSVQTSRESEILTELDILRSRKLAEKVVELMGPETILNGGSKKTSNLAEKTPESSNRIMQNIRKIKGGLKYVLQRAGLKGRLSDRDKAVLAVMDNSAITTEKEVSQTINVSFESKSPHFAQQVLSRFIDAYLEEHVAVHKTSGSYEFFVQQSGIARDNLSRLEAQLRSLQKGSSMSLINEEQKIILNRIGSLESEIGREEASLGASKARAQKLIETLEELPETVVTSTTTGHPNRAADSMRERLYELQLTELDLLSKYDEQTRPVREIRRQVAEAQAVLETEEREGIQTTTGLNSARQETELSLHVQRASISALEMRITCLKQKLTQAQTQLQSLNDKAARMKSLSREIEIQESNYRKYANNLEQTRIDQALMADRISNITIVQPATFPIAPVGPGKGMQLVLGMLLSVSGSVALAFLCEYLNRTAKKSPTPKSKGKLGLSVLANLPYTCANIVCPIERGNEFSQDSDDALQFKFEEWDIPEAVKVHYEGLMQKILSSWSDHPDESRVLAITSSHPGKGVSTVAANLATILACNSNESVLLVDANFARPTLHSIFHVNASVGFLDILSYEGDWNDFIWPLPLKNLSLLPAGTLNESPLEAGIPSKIGEILDQLKKEYRYIVIDVPSVEQADWAVRLSAACDGVGLVAEADNTHREAVQVVKEQLSISNANILGIVLNETQSSVPDRPYVHYREPVETLDMN